MTTTSGKLVIIDLGATTVRYLWNGVELQGVVKVFIYKGIALSITVLDKNAVPTTEMVEYGIKVKEVRNG